jgi:hypothetical protein
MGYMLENKRKIIINWGVINLSKAIISCGTPCRISTDILTTASHFAEPNLRLSTFGFDRQIRDQGCRGHASIQEHSQEWLCYSMIRPLRIPIETASVRLVAFSLPMIEAT